MLIPTADYFYLPAECEINMNEASNQLKEQEISPTWYQDNGAWPWLKVSNINNWFINSSGNQLVTSTAPNVYPFLYRFVGNYIKPTSKIYYINRDPYNNGSTWTYNNDQVAVQSGDVWVLSENYNNGNYSYNAGTAFIYYTNAEINEGVYVNILTDGGGWKKADLWQLRTMNLDQNNAYENLLDKVEDNGSLTTTQGNRYKPDDPHIICPEFSI